MYLLAGPGQHVSVLWCRDKNGVHGVGRVGEFKKGGWLGHAHVYNPLLSHTFHLMSLVFKLTVRPLLLAIVGSVLTPLY